MTVSASALHKAKLGLRQPTSLASETQASGRFTVDRLLSIINRLGSTVEVKIKVRRAEKVERELVLSRVQ